MTAIRDSTMIQLLPDKKLTAVKKITDVDTSIYMHLTALTRTRVLQDQHKMARGFFYTVISNEECFGSKTGTYKDDR